MENNTILKFDGLSKKFGNKTVVDHWTIVNKVDRKNRKIK